MSFTKYQKCKFLLIIHDSSCPAEKWENIHVKSVNSKPSYTMLARASLHHEDIISTFLMEQSACWTAVRALVTMLTALLLPGALPYGLHSIRQLEQVETKLREVCQR